MVVTKRDKLYTALGAVTWAATVVLYLGLALLAPLITLSQLRSLLAEDLSAPLVRQTAVYAAFTALLTAAAWVYILHGRRHVRESPTTRYVYMNVLPVLLLAKVGCESLFSSGTFSSPGIALASALPPIVVSFIWWRWKVTRRPPWHCRVCGYDLTGNLSGRCPECGTSVWEYPRRPK